MNHTAENDAPAVSLWEHHDGTPCPNTADTWTCDEHGEQTRVTPPVVTEETP